MRRVATAATAAAAAAVTLGSMAMPSSPLSAPSSLSYCGTVMNDSTGIYTFSTVDNTTGVITNILSLPTLDSYGDGISAGAEYGVYYTVSGNVSEQEEIFVVDVGRKTATWKTITLPQEYAFLSLYGVGALNIDEATHFPVAMVLGYASDGMRYSFLGLIDPTTGAVTSVLANLTAAYRTWVYLYAGITAWDGRYYYLSAVTGPEDTTTLYGFDTSSSTGGKVGIPEITVPYNGLGDFMSLFVSEPLARQRASGGGTGLLALVDDDSNTAAALWLLGPDNATWIKLYQYPPDTLESGGSNDMVMSVDGLTAYSVFYDNHTPIANQIVSTVFLGGTGAPVEVSRTIVQGSERGTAIADIARCPSNSC